MSHVGTETAKMILNDGKVREAEIENDKLEKSEQERVSWEQVSIERGGQMMRETLGNITTVLSPCSNRGISTSSFDSSPLYGTLHRYTLSIAQPVRSFNELYRTNLLSARPASNCRIINWDLSRRMRCLSSSSARLVEPFVFKDR